MRIALGIEYDGADFYGWQSQENLRTVQSVVEDALSTVANEPIQVICAGRTDTHVHAAEQVIHFDTSATRKEFAWVMGANANLPEDVSVKWAKKVDETFHARYSATSRLYRYTISNQPFRPSLYRHYVAWYPHQLDEVKMLLAAQDLLGEHDFSSYRSSDCQSKTPFRHIHSIEIKRDGELITIDIKANAFLHHMVRNIMGVLMAIGVGKQPVTWAKEVLLARDRTKAGVTAPARGLCLIKVEYP